MAKWLDAAPVGDPARVHAEGTSQRATIEEARERVAAVLEIASRQVVFTSSASEAVATATFSATRSRPGAVLAASVEHSSVLESARQFGELRSIPTDPLGRVDVEAVAAALSRCNDHPVSLVHCQVGNHEVGTLQPVTEIADLCRRSGVLLHCDAAASGCKLPAFDEIGADFVSISSHKLGGPPGVGVLVVRRGLRLVPLVRGGAQERSRRAGMENVVGIVGFAAALEAMHSNRSREEATQRELISAMLDSALAIPGVHLAGPPDSKERLPHIACIVFDDLAGEPLLVSLDALGIAAHSGSSCSSEELAPSPVLEAMGLDPERSLRLSVGWSSTADDARVFADVFPAVVARLRNLAS